MKKRILNGYDILLGWMMAVIFLLLMMCSCKSIEYVPVIEHNIDTLIKTNVQHDSVYVHDSVSVLKNGDTVTIHEYHTKYKLIELHDTLYHLRTDSIPYPVEVTKEVPAELTWWQQTRLHLANILLFALLIAAIIWIGKRHIKFLGG